MVEYSAFNRLVPGSNPGRPIIILFVYNLTLIELFYNIISYHIGEIDTIHIYINISEYSKEKIVLIRKEMYTF